jgi:hypothetical protein
MWTLFPADPSTHDYFLFSDTMMTKQTYVWFMCYYCIQLIIVRIWYEKFPGYHLIFGSWFIFQSLEFIEFLLTYNESVVWFYVGHHKIDLNVINFKYMTIITLLIHKFTWKT